MTQVARAREESRAVFRRKILDAEATIKKLISDGDANDAIPECTLTHSFTPINEEYGCCTYARQMFIPKGIVVVGKIHRHASHNFLLEGRLRISTEDGIETISAPCMFVGKAGVKRAIYAEEDSVFVNVHLTKFNSEGELELIEDEVIAPSYEDIGLSVAEVKRI